MCNLAHHEVVRNKNVKTWVVSARLQGAYLNNLFLKAAPGAQVNEVEFEDAACMHNAHNALSWRHSPPFEDIVQRSATRSRRLSSPTLDAQAWASSRRTLEQHCASLLGMFRLSCIDTRWASLYLNILQERRVVVSSLLTRLRSATCSERLSLKNQRRVRSFCLQQRPGVLSD